MPTKKVGAPKDSLAARLIGLFAQSRFDGIALGLFENLIRREIELPQYRSQAIGFVDVLIVHKVEFHHLTAEGTDPGLSSSNERNAGWQHA